MDLLNSVAKIENTWSLDDSLTEEREEKSPVTLALVVRVVGHQVATVHVCRQLIMVIMVRSLLRNMMMRIGPLCMSVPSFW